MKKLKLIAIDLAKNIFQVCGFTTAHTIAFNKSISRHQLLTFIEKGDILVSGPMKFPLHSAPLCARLRETLAVKGYIVMSKIKNTFKKEPPDLSLTDKLWELLQNEKYKELIPEAKKLLGHKSAPVAKDANRLMGMSFFRQAKYQEALPYFLKATEYNPEVND